MQMSEIFAEVKSLAENDLSIQDSQITKWVDQGINRINQLLQCDIPRTIGKPTTYIPEFDERFHECLILFSVGKYRESDSDYNAAQYLMGQFNDMCMQMQRDMVIKPSFRKDFNVQQIIVTDASKLTHYLSMPSGSYFDKVEVYKNDEIVDPGYYGISFGSRTITFKGVTLTVNDKITVVFENNSDLNNPPYEWWGQSGW